MKRKQQIIGTVILLSVVAAAVSTAQERDPLPVPDIPGYRTLKAEFHSHTVFSDGQVWPTTRVAEAWRDGLDVLAITDHAGYNPNKQDVATDVARPYAIARPAAERLGLILIPGVEFMQGDLHCNALFIKDPNELVGLKLIEAGRKAKAQGAFVFWNHPGWKQKAEWFPIIDSMHREKLIDGIELINGMTFYPEAYPWVEEKNLTITATSDIHAPILPQYPARTRPLTLVFARTADVDGVREALFARRTVGWMGGELWGGERLLRGLWEGAVSVLNPELKSGVGTGAPALRLRNTSAIPFQFRVRKAPAWLTVAGGSLRPEGMVGLAVTVARDAPAGNHNVALEVEVTNLHTGPGNNLVVQVPLRVEVSR